MSENSNDNASDSNNSNVGTKDTPIESPVSFHSCNNSNDNSNDKSENYSNFGTKDSNSDGYSNTNVSKDKRVESPVSFHSLDSYKKDNGIEENVNINDDNDNNSKGFLSFKKAKDDTRSRGSSISSKSNYEDESVSSSKKKDKSDWGSIDDNYSDKDLTIKTNSDTSDNQNISNRSSSNPSIKQDMPLKDMLQSIFSYEDNPNIKAINVKSNNIERTYRNFTNLSIIEERRGTDGHYGAIWTMKFSADGLYLCTGGHDTNVIVWRIGSTLHKTVHSNDDDENDSHDSKSLDSKEGSKTGSNNDDEHLAIDEDHHHHDHSYEFISHKPYRKFRGHTADVTDVSWSGSQFILSSSVDKSVILWHIKKGALQVYKHKDIVTSVQFHPQNDAYFISGSTDEVLTLWNIVDFDNKENYEPNTSKFFNSAGKKITSICFSNDGSKIAGGSINGKIQIWKYEERNGSSFLERYGFETDVRNRRGKHSLGKKVTGLMFIDKKDRGAHSFKRRIDTGENLQLLVTTNDNRIRLIDMDDTSTIFKFKGSLHSYKNKSMQIKGTVSEDAKYVICGSDGGSVFLWNIGYSPPKGCINKKYRHNMYESFDPMSNGVSTTCAIFAPSTCFNKIFNDNNIDSKQYDIKESDVCSRFIVTADSLGNIKVFLRDLRDD